jgi:hypothetical protein
MEDNLLADYKAYYSVRAEKYAGNPNYAHIGIRRWRFDAGIGTGPVNEMGAGKNVNGTQLFTHHNVSPQFDKAANQVLDTYYKLSVFPDLTDIVGSGVIGTETYDTVIRGLRYGENRNIFDTWVQGGTLRNYDGELAAFTAQAPLGNSSSNPTNTKEELGYGTITNGMYHEQKISCGLDVGNIGDGSVGVRSTIVALAQQYAQCRFGADGNGVLALDDEIPKDVEKEMVLNFRYEWMRK